MLLHGRRMNKSLIWGLVRIEQERLLNEHYSFSKWEVLEALQSLVVYILLRIIEGRQNYTDFDTQLLASINAMCDHITTKYGRLISSDELKGRMIPWKDWVFFESRRRTATAVLIINSIVHAQIRTPSPVMPEYSYSPAPSPMTLWHAENETDWAVDYAEYLHKNAMHGMLKNGDLVELKEAAGKQHDRCESYPAISPSRPELSAKGKTVVITGGGSGIGASIVKAFAAGGSTKIAIMSRTEKKLLATKHTIEEEFPGTEVLAVTADITNAKQVTDAFVKISQKFGKINVFVCNSAFLPVPRAVFSPDFDAEEWWAAFSTNVLGALYSVRGFIRHAAEGAHILHISTCVCHIPPMEAGPSAYSASKAAATKFFDHVAYENPGLNVVNVHPGLIESDMSRKSGHRGMDHIDLPGHFCLWLASPEAAFLRGKFVWVNWDIDELKARKEEIQSTDLLNTKLGGLSFVGWELPSGS
ncbi:hypothetical protein DL771_006232 [Monosporascus sp. 5C6A]|nr:hypothetical protein DL771_006232 [Monosporascus sp. 5C6A]